MDILFILFGAALAIGGGLIGQRQEQILRRQREEEEVLLQLNDALLDLHSLRSQARTLADGSLGVAAAQFVLPNQAETARAIELLTKLAIKIRRADHRDIAVRVNKVALDPPFQTDANISALIREVQLRINKPMIDRYERELRESPSKF